MTSYLLNHWATRVCFSQVSRLSPSVKCQGCPLQSSLEIVWFSQELRLCTSVNCQGKVPHCNAMTAGGAISTLFYTWFRLSWHALNSYQRMVPHIINTWSHHYLDQPHQGMVPTIIIALSQFSTVLFVLLPCLWSLLCVMNGLLLGQVIYGLPPGTWDKWMVYGTSNMDCPWDQCHGLSLKNHQTQQAFVLDCLWGKRHIAPGTSVIDFSWDKRHRLSLGQVL